MIEPTQADIGRGVVYTGNRYPGGELEYGVITSFTDYSVFVRYDGSRHAQATQRSDLEWEMPGREPVTNPNSYEELEARLRQVSWPGDYFAQAADALADLRKQRDEARDTLPPPALTPDARSSESDG